MAVTGLRAQVTAVQQALLSASSAGTLEAVTKKDGETFKKGDLLAAFDCSLPKARYARARAAESAAAAKVRSVRELARLNSASRTDVAEAEAAVQVARAETAAEKILVERCRVEAPFDGVVGETFVHTGEYVQEGARLLSVFDVTGFEVETILPSRALRFVKTGTPFTVTVDETGRTYEGRVIRIAGNLDPVSQSVKVTGSVVDKAIADLKPGMSGAVHFVEVP